MTSLGVNLCTPDSAWCHLSNLFTPWRGRERDRRRNQIIERVLKAHQSATERLVHESQELGKMVEDLVA